MQLIKIIKQHCDGCPMVWDCLLPDGSAGYIKFRWGEISLKKVTERAGIFQDPIIWEKIGDDFDGVLSLDEAKTWLEKNGYTVEISIIDN